MLFDSRDKQISGLDQLASPQRRAAGIFLLILGVGLGIACLRTFGSVDRGTRKYRFRYSQQRVYTSGGCMMTGCQRVA
jgi:hypothetical protein